ncbi:MAG: type II secretion system protein [Acidobacteria bacterium]|nr:type II secretion system protein [Acidobacteriota bacterium]
MFRRLLHAKTQREDAKAQKGLRGKGRQERGVTLLELLIAVTLLSLLVAGVLTAMRVGITALQRTNQRVIANRRAVGAQRILEQQIAAFVPASADCNAAGGPPPYQKIGFFQGELQTMRLVSAYSLAEAGRGMAQILEFQVIPGENGVGVRLVVNEHPYSGGHGTGRFCLGVAFDPASGATVPRFVPVETGPRSFVLADKLAACRILYRESLLEAPFERWVPRWILTSWPTAIRIEMVPLEADASKILPTTLTIPVFVNRVPMGLYGD